MSLKLGALILLIVAATTSCGKKKDPGQYLSMLVLPSTSILGTGPIQSCDDALKGNDASVRGPLIYFPRFVLDWKSTDKSLILSQIRVTFQGSGIMDGKFVASLSYDELKALVGTAVMPPDTVSDSTLVNPPASATRAIVRHVKCGLIVGDIPLVDKTNTQSFKARIKVEVIGTALNATATEQEFVHQTEYVSADYISY